MSRRVFDLMGEIENKIVAAPHILLCLDFDGTLAALMDDPGDAHLSPQMKRVLEALVAQERITLAIISGRERSDLETRIGIRDLIYSGNHGLEIRGGGLLFVEPTAVMCSSAIHELGLQLAKKLAAIPNVIVEDKTLTLSVHYRRVEPERYEDVRRMVHAVLASTDHPYQLTTGNKVFEIRPRANWTKADAVHWIIAKLGKADPLVIFVGDDQTDEDAFAGLPEGLTIRVGGEAESLARYELEGPAEVRKFLEWVKSLVA